MGGFTQKFEIPLLFRSQIHFYKLGSTYLLHNTSLNSLWSSSSSSFPIKRKKKKFFSCNHYTNESVSDKITFLFNSFSLQIIRSQLEKKKKEKILFYIAIFLAISLVSCQNHLLQLLTLQYSVLWPTNLYLTTYILA